MRTPARPAAGQTALLLSSGKIQDEEEPVELPPTKERKTRCTTEKCASTRALALFRTVSGKTNSSGAVCTAPATVNNRSA